MKSVVETKKLIINNLILKVMKKLNKLQIETEKLMKKEELILLRGGYDVDCMDPCSDKSPCQNPGCSVCMEPIGWPGQKYCFNS